MNTNRIAPPTVPPKPGETQPTHVDVDPAPGHEEILEGDETEEDDDEEEIEGLDEEEEEEDSGSEDDEVEDD